jgi:hypothetical protein
MMLYNKEAQEESWLLQLDPKDFKNLWGLFMNLVYRSLLLTVQPNEKYIPSPKSIVHSF